MKCEAAQGQATGSVARVPLGRESSPSSDTAGQPGRPSPEAPSAGRLIINGDDWGRDQGTTDRTLECFLRGAVSSVSAMVFMEDSERAAAMARERRLDAGLHLNFTTQFSARNCSPKLIERQRELGKRLLRHRLSQLIFYPSLMKSFEYVVSSQIEEFCRLYGTPPARLDGHHHMHLCGNVLLGRLLPPDTIVRRNFSFGRGEKSWGNRFFRRTADYLLARRHRLTDFFFSLTPLEPPARLQRIFSLARCFVVEVETHPFRPEEYRFLAGGEIFRWAGDSPIAPRFMVRSQRNGQG